MTQEEFVAEYARNELDAIDMNDDLDALHEHLWTGAFFLHEGPSVNSFLEKWNTEDRGDMENDLQAWALGVFMGS